MFTMDDDVASSPSVVLALATDRDSCSLTKHRYVHIIHLISQSWCGPQPSTLLANSFLGINENAQKLHCWRTQTRKAEYHPKSVTSMPRRPFPQPRNKQSTKKKTQRRTPLAATKTERDERVNFNTKIKILKPRPPPRDMFIALRQSTRNPDMVKTGRLYPKRPSLSTHQRHLDP